MIEKIQPASSDTAAANQVGDIPRGTTLDLPPSFVNMSPVEAAFEQIMEAYATRCSADRPT